MSFIIDNAGKSDNDSKPITYIPYGKINESSDDDWDSQEVEPPSFVKQIIENIKNLNAIELNEKPIIKPPQKPETYNIDLEKIYEELGWNDEDKDKQESIDKVNSRIVEKANRTNSILKKSLITSGFEKRQSVPEYCKSNKKIKLERKHEREKTKGKKWYGLPATEVTENVKNDLEVLQMRSVLDPKHFYKKNDMKVLPKYFQIGKVMDSPIDYYNNRCTRKERKRTLVDELLADAEFNRYNKKRYVEIIEEKQKTHYKAYQKAKKLKRKK